MRPSVAVAATVAVSLGASLVPAGAAANGRLAAQIAYVSQRIHVVKRDLDFFMTDSQTLVASCAAARHDRTRGKLQVLAAETATMAGNFHDGPDRQLAQLRGRLRVLLEPGASFGVDSSRLQAAAKLLDDAAASVQVGDGNVVVALAAAGRGDCTTANRAWKQAGQTGAGGLSRLDAGLQALRALR